MSNFDNEVFEGKTLADVFKDIYNNTDTKRKQINEFIKKLVMMIKTPEDAVVLGPVIKDFFEVNVKNDEHLVRVAQIAQRVVSIGAKVNGSEGVLTDSEKEQLLKELSIEVAEIKIQAEALDNEIFDLESKSV
jgi:hypothetical protein